MDTDAPFLTWDLHLPDVAAMAAPGEVLSIRLRRWQVPGVGRTVTHLRIELRRAEGILSFDPPANSEFLLVCGGIALAPIVLWAVAALTIGLATRRRRQAPPLDS
jgi:hypothetical protein